MAVTVLYLARCWEHGLSRSEGGSLRAGGRRRCVHIGAVVPRVEASQSFARFCRVDPTGLDFYVFVFTQGEFEAFLRSCDFEVVEVAAYGGFKGVTDKIGFFRSIMRWRGVGWRLHNWLQDSPWVSRCNGNMILFVCRKKTGTSTRKGTS